MESDRVLLTASISVIPEQPLISMEKYPQARTVLRSIRGTEKTIQEAKLRG